VPWAIACQSIAGMYSDTQGALIPFTKEQLKAIIDQQDKIIINLQNNIVSITETLRLIHDTNQATQVLADRIHHLEQQLRVNHNSTTKNILSHPATWLALIAVYYMATKYYEYRHKEKVEKDEERDTNLDEHDKSTHFSVPDQVA